MLAVKKSLSTEFESNVRGCELAFKFVLEDELDAVRERFWVCAAHFLYTINKLSSSAVFVRGT